MRAAEKLFLGGGEQGAGLVDEHPAGRDQTLKRVTRVAVQGHLAEHVFGAFQAVHQGGFDQLGPSLKVPVERHPAHAGLGGDVGDRGIGVLLDRGDGGGEHPGPVALRVGPLIGRPSPGRRGLLVRRRHAHTSQSRIGMYEIV